MIDIQRNSQMLSKVLREISQYIVISKDSKLDLAYKNFKTAIINIFKDIIFMSKNIDIYSRENKKQVGI